VHFHVFYRKSVVVSVVFRKRPFFTVWVTIVQVIIFFVIIGTYGVAPIGIGQKQVTARVGLALIRPVSMYSNGSIFYDRRMQLCKIWQCNFCLVSIYRFISIL